ncbi:alanine racemase [Luteolibacter pohnpeiensis]|uniref:Alanine racemase n=2 Tax=Luteolibacter pohnpeiensis TaxID=454153 RepID=A0A934S820_9BACT|nr:alanine racemase [Luteolibacter pohnpeiensis]
MRRNLEVARQSGPVDVMAVVKADAYGHGLEQISKGLEHAGILFFGVANVGEGRRIQAAGVKTRIYLLGATWAAERDEIVTRDFTPCLSSMVEAQDFDRIAKQRGVRFRVHLALDTGMGRGGFLIDELPELLPKLQSLENLEIEGLGSHLPSADEDEAFTKRQFAVFRESIEKLGGIDQFKIRHLANSAGLLGYEGEVCNLVRPGLMLYGISPLPAFQEKLSNVLTLKSRITLIRTLPPGHGVSYGREFVTSRPTRVATVGIGYGDGYPRQVSGKDAEVWIKGQRFPIIGRVTMDQTMIDVTGADEIAEGDEVEMFGANLSVTEVSKKAGMIVWEIFTGIAPRVVRCYQD